MNENCYCQLASLVGDFLVDIVVLYLSKNDIELSEIVSYIKDSVWKNKTLFEFGFKLASKKSKGTFCQWKDFYYYLDFMTYAKTDVYNVDISNEICLMELILVSQYLEEFVVYLSKISTDIAEKLTQLALTVKRGDILTINTDMYIFFIDVCDENKKKLVKISGRDAPSNFSAIFEFPIHYFQNTNLGIDFIYITNVSPELEYYVIDDLPNLCGIVDVHIIIHQNIVYALLHSKARTKKKKVTSGGLRFRIPCDHNEIETIHPNLLEVLHKYNVTLETILLFGL